LAFFVLVCFHKQAFDAALNEKSLSTLLTGFAATLGASLDEFAIDLKAILELKINNK